MSEKPLDDKRKERTFLYTLARIATRLTVRGGLFPVQIRGHEKIAGLRAPAIIIANHRSLMDPLTVACYCPYEIRFLGKRELAEKKAGRLLFRSLHMIPVSRHETDMAAMRACVKALKEGYILGIFPEGTRCPDSLMERPESGTALIALRSGAVLLPVYIEEKPRFLRRTRALVGDPIPYDDLKREGISNETAGILTERIRETFFRLRDENEKEKKHP